LFKSYDFPLQKKEKGLYSIGGSTSEYANKADGAFRKAIPEFFEMPVTLFLHASKTALLRPFAAGSGL